jgi:hypothetical protein
MTQSAMAAADNLDAAPSTSRDLRATTLLIVSLLMESMPLIAIVVVVGKLPGNHAETISAWGVLGLVGTAVVTTRWLSGLDISANRRRLLGALLTIVALQVIGRMDLSESLRFWDVGWISELADPDSNAFRKFGRVDHVVNGFLLLFIWFRGVFLANMDPEERGLMFPIFWASLLFGIGFIGGDDLGVESTVRITALVYVMIVLSVVAFRAAGRAQGSDAGSFRTTSASFMATLAMVWAAIAIFMLVVLLIIAAIAGTGVAEPVTDTLGDGLEALIKGFSYILWPFAWLFEQFGNNEASPLQLDAISFTTEGIGGAGDEETIKEINLNAGGGALVVRIFGAIGLIVLFAILVTFLFRRLSSRTAEEDEERDSLWEEAHVLDDFLGSLRGLRNRFRRGDRSASNDAAIAQLYFDVLSDAEGRGLSRPPARTPLQFARALKSQYRSDVPVEISERFTRLRYADAPTPDADLSRLRGAWKTLRESTT